jgi:biopolymer transport protein ExbD
MRFRRSTKLLVEPSSVTTGDIAFNLIVFFLVCASVQPDSGRQQSVPRSEQQEKEKAETEHIEVRLTRTTAAINGDVVRARDFVPRLRALLAGKTRPEDKIVVVRSERETPYRHWIAVTAMIEEAGGIITILREEEREVQLPRQP